MSAYFWFCLSEVLLLNSDDFLKFLAKSIVDAAIDSDPGFLDAYKQEREKVLHKQESALKRNQNQR